MKTLHTSDWHLGRSLYGRKRYDEFNEFLTWLSETIQQEQIDVLLVAGDIFDTSTPSNRAQKLYYQFLCQVANSHCRHVVIIAGNHDSPSFLNAPKELLRALDVHVIGSISETPEDEVLLLHDQEGNSELIVCAVPYLRDRDIRTVEAGESIEDKERKLIEGIRGHYSSVCELAEQKRNALGADIPIIAMGHLFTAGGATVEGDGTRPLYVGSIAHVTSAIFPECIDYLALGHLHVPQKVSGSEVMRYCGSPLPMGFGEARQEKSLCLVGFVGRAVTVELIKVPCFQQLESIRGNWEEIAGRILELAVTQNQAWLEILYEGDEVIADLRERLEEATSESGMEVLRVRNNRIIDRVLNRIHEVETLDDLNENDVFERCLDAHNVPDEQRPDLLLSYQEIVTSLHEADT
jgi:exonuclease SbcD